MLLEAAGKFLLTRYQFMIAMHLRQPDNVYSHSVPFTKKKERIQSFKETAYFRYIY